MPLEPNTKKLLILGTAVGAAILAVIWFFMVNTGMLEISADPPYSVSISPKGGERECLTKTCEISLPPHAYTVTVAKKGYFSQSKEIEIRRGETYATSFEPEFIPVIVETTGMEIGKRPKVVLPRYEDLIWNFDGDILYFLEKSRGAGQQRLSRYLQNSGEEEVIAYWKRAMSQAILRLSNDEKTLLVIDKSTEPASLYLVDLEKKSREKILKDQNILDDSIRPSKKYNLYEAKGIFIFDREKKK
ncbi:hypothetical protein HZA41_03115, partial [Candidatus Peregrinibacteria bacterium]|nr:hypothetical protein [Candidatus Peregrinibacteria bacterium]